MAGNITCILLLSLLVLSSIGFGIGENVTALYLFGDGLLDVGNNNYLQNIPFRANFPPNGIDRKKIANTRFSNGKNYADFLAEKVGLETSAAYYPFIFDKSGVPFPLSGVNFASGGAGILKDTDDPLLLSKQLNCFVNVVHEELEEKLGSTAAQIIHLTKSLFVVSIGTNDIINYYKSGSDIPRKPNPEAYVGSMLIAFQQALEDMYLNGHALKYVVIGSGPVGCLPFLRNQNKGRVCNDEANNMALAFNEGLKIMLEILSSGHKDFYYSFINEYNVVSDLIQRSTFFGFEEVAVGCCKPGVNIQSEIPCLPFSDPCSNRTCHLFWDQYHPTEAATKHSIDLVFEGSYPYVFPINIKQLIQS